MPFSHVYSRLLNDVSLHVKTFQVESEGPGFEFQSNVAGLVPDLVSTVSGGAQIKRGLVPTTQTGPAPALQT